MSDEFVTFDSEETVDRVLNATRRVEEMLQSSVPPPPPSTVTGAPVLVRVTGAKVDGKVYYPGMFTFRNGETDDTITYDDYEEETCRVEDPNGGELESGKVYRGQVVDVQDGFALVQVSKRGAGSSGGWFARLTTSSGGKWKYFVVGWNGTIWANIGSESPDYTAVPSTIDGVSLCSPVVNLRVWMIPSETAGFQEFLPIGYADTTAYTTAGTYTPGLVSIGVQGFKGAKYFLDTITIRSVNAAQLPIVAFISDTPVIQSCQTAVFGALVIANGVRYDSGSGSGDSYGGGLHIYSTTGDVTHRKGGGASIRFWGDPQLNPGGVGGGYPRIDGATRAFGLNNSFISLVGDSIVVPDPGDGRVYVGADSTVDVTTGFFYFKAALSTGSYSYIPPAEIFNVVVKNGMVTDDYTTRLLDPDVSDSPDQDFNARRSICNGILPDPIVLPATNDALLIWQSHATGNWIAQNPMLGAGSGDGTYTLQALRASSGVHWTIGWTKGDVGTVTSLSGGTTGLTVTNPTTTPTLGGTLGIPNGGTNATTAAGAWANISPSSLSGTRP